MPFVQIDTDSVNDFDHVSVSIGTTAAQLWSSDALLLRGIGVKADPANTAVIYIGKSDVTANTTAATDGFPLSPGEELFLPLKDGSTVYGRSGSASQKAFIVVV